MKVKIIESNGLYTVFEHNGKQYMVDTTFAMIKWEVGDVQVISKSFFETANEIIKAEKAREGL